MVVAIRYKRTEFCDVRIVFFRFLSASLTLFVALTEVEDGGES